MALVSNSELQQKNETSSKGQVLRKEERKKEKEILEDKKFEELVNSAVDEENKLPDIKPQKKEQQEFSLPPLNLSSKKLPELSLVKTADKLPKIDDELNKSNEMDDLLGDSFKQP